MSKEFSRKSFLKGGGALVVGFSARRRRRSPARRPRPRRPRRATCPTSTRSTRGSRSAPTTRVTLKTSQIEIGNGITTGFLQVRRRRARHGHVADALRPLQPRQTPPLDTLRVGGTGGEGGSNAMSGTGPKIRAAAALREAGAARASPRRSSASRSRACRSTRASSRAAASRSPTASCRRQAASTSPALERRRSSRAWRRRSRVATTRRSRWRHGRPRIDIPDKVTGKYTYVHNVRMPGMLHGRMVRPRGQGAYPYNSNVAGQRRRERRSRTSRARRSCT